GMTAVVVLSILFGIIQFIGGGIQLLNYLPAASNEFGAQASFAAAMGGCNMVVGVLGIVSAIGVSQLARWGRTLSIAYAIAWLFVTGLSGLPIFMNMRHIAPRARGPFVV